MKKNNRRWSDVNYHWGPFTYSPSNSSIIDFVLVSSSENDCGAYDGCHLRLTLFKKHTLILELPPLIKPYKKWIDTSYYSWSVGQGGYWDVHPKEYGFSLSHDGGFVQIFFGPQTHDSETTKNYCFFIPWKEWTFKRQSFYDLDGKEVWSGNNINLYGNKIKDAFPTKTFTFADFDGEEIQARTRIEELEWTKGAGWFSWLRFFSKPKIRRYLDLEFSSEVGPGKGSWKGGTLGHSIQMEKGELHEAAFRRYCEQNNMTYLSEYESFPPKNVDFESYGCQSTQKG